MDNVPRSMEPVHNFTNELFSLYDFKVPVSKAKMGAITKSAMKAIKFYKHVVQNVEKFILKCKPEYKIPGLYVIDSIVRQSRHQFGAEKDVFAPRFARNMEATFAHLFRCSQEDKSKIIRVLNLWQKNNVFAPEVIQPLFDLANPDHRIHQNYMQQQQQQAGQQNDMSLSNGMNMVRESPHQKDETNPEMLNASNLQKFQFQQMMMQQNVESGNNSSESTKFKQLLEYDYGSEEEKNDGVMQSAAMHQQYQATAMSTSSGLPYQFTKVLEDPNILKQLQSINKMDVQRYLNEMPAGSGSVEQQQQQQQQQQSLQMSAGITLANINSLRNPQSLIDNSSKDQDVELVGEPEIIPIDVSSRSPTPTRHKRRRSRSHSRDRYGSRRRRSRSTRSRSPRNRRRSSRDRDRTKEKEREKQREIEKERRRKGLPDVKKDHLSVCSTTLWVGHLSKLVQQEELSDTFGKYGDIVSIDMIPPRGCAYIVMNRRQDAHKAMQALKSHKLQNRAITLSWAAGKGVKGKEWKDYFDQTLGVTYIPYTKLTESTDFEALEEGGMYDEETMPSWVKEKMKQPQQPPAKEGIVIPQFFGLPTDVSSIDTSQPPPNASLLPAMPPFPLGNIPRLLMPGVLPLGVPPPNMLNMVFPPASVSLDKATAIPPPNLLGFPMATAAAAAQSAASNISSNSNNQQNNDDHMDIEMEDEQHSTKSNDIVSMQQAFYQPPPNLSSLMMQAANQAASNLNQNSSSDPNDDFSRLRDGRNNRSQSREKDRNDFRRGSRPDYNNRNNRWPNDSNSRDNRRDNNGRSRDSGNQSNFNRRGGHQQEIPSLLPQSMIENDNMSQRQRNNDFNSNREDFNDRRQPFANRGFNNQQRGVRGGPAFRGGNFGGRGNMRGGYNNSYNDRPGFHDRDMNNQRGGRRNWNREDENDRRGGFQQRGGNFDRNNRNMRWTGNQRGAHDDSEEGPNDQNDSNDYPEQQDDSLPPGTENYEEPAMNQHHETNDYDDNNQVSEEQSNAVNDHADDNNSSSVNVVERCATPPPASDASAAVVDENPGNTTPLCDEAKE